MLRTVAGQGDRAPRPWTGSSPTRPTSGFTRSLGRAVDRHIVAGTPSGHIEQLPSGSWRAKGVRRNRPAHRPGDPVPQDMQDRAGRADRAGQAARDGPDRASSPIRPTSLVSSTSALDLRRRHVHGAPSRFGYAGMCDRKRQYAARCGEYAAKSVLTWHAGDLHRGQRPADDQFRERVRDLAIGLQVGLDVPLRVERDRAHSRASPRPG